MAQLGETRAAGRTTRWLGRSGRVYGLVGESLDSFAMNETDLYLIAKGSHALWVGSTGELVGDPMSRTRFRLALDCADRVFRLAGGAAESDRLAVVWDLEGGGPAPEWAAQAA